MKERYECLSVKMSKSLIAVALSLSLPLSVQADNTAKLMPETASLDSGQPVNPDSPPTKTETLYGGVKKRQELPDVTGTSQNTLHDLNATDNDAKLQPEKASTDASSLYALAAKKLAAGQELSADEYRSLGVGCAGYESNRTFFQPVAKISVVYRGSPADKAGLRKGDKVLDTSPEDKEARSNPQQPLWAVACGLAGTPVHLTLLRHGQQIAMTLIRTNIEDIQEPKYRQQWEQIIRKLGYPQGGTFIGPNLNSLHATSSLAPEGS